MTASFPLGARYLHDSPEARRFVSSLGFAPDTFTVKVGYKQDNKVLQEPPIGFREQYFMKSRGETNLDNYEEKTTMNQGKASFTALNLDLSDLTNRLQTSLHLNTKVCNIEVILNELMVVKHKGVTEDLPYDSLVSTIPLPVFLSLAGHDDMTKFFKSEGVTFCLLNKSHFDMADYGFIYCAGAEPYHRMSKCDDGVVVEMLGYHTESECIERFNSKYIGSKFVPNSQLITGIPAKYLQAGFPNVKFVGRYGAWDREQKADYVIKEASK